MSSLEIAEWMVYYKLEPFGVEMENFRFSILCASVLNATRTKKQQAIHPKKFMEIFDRVDMNKTQSIEEQMKVMNSFSKENI